MFHIYFKIIIISQTFTVNFIVQILFIVEYLHKTWHSWALWLESLESRVCVFFFF